MGLIRGYVLVSLVGFGLGAACKPSQVHRDDRTVEDKSQVSDDVEGLPNGTEEGFELVGPALQKLGPIDPLHGFPMWYSDANGNRLELCVDGDPLCVLPPPNFNTNAPVRFPENFPNEAFYWMADARLNVVGGGSIRVVFAIEAAFSLGDPMPGHHITFARTLFVSSKVTDGVYRITHPYGVHDLVIGGGKVRDVTDVGVADEVFTGVLNSNGSLLRWGSADEPPGYFGNGAVAHSFTGSPLGTNFFRIESIVGNTSKVVAESNQASISGRLARNIAAVSPGPGTYAAAPSVTLVADDPGKSILYAVVPASDTTTRPTNPYTVGSKIVLSGTGPTILRTALTDGNTLFPEKDYAYFIDPTAISVDASPSPGIQAGPTDVSLSMQGQGTEIWYTLDGSDPLTNPAKKVYANSPISIASNGRTLVRYLGVQLNPTNNTVSKSSPERKAYYTIRAEQFTRSEVNPAIEMPFWFKDQTGLALVPCVDPLDPYCLPGSLDPTLPVVYPRNFSNETFIWNATAVLKAADLGKALLVMAIEGAFPTPTISAGERTLFSRLRIRVDISQAGRYRVVTPYGTHFFDVTAAGVGIKAINYTEDVSPIPNNFDAARFGQIGPFLHWPQGSGAPTGYVGDPAVPHQLTGSPFNTNYFEVAQQQADLSYKQVIFTDLFAVSGKLAPVPALDVAASPMGAYYPTSRLVSLGASEAGATISYSTDGLPWSSPNSSKRIYNTPFLVDVGKTVVQYQAVTATESSLVQTSTYTIDITQPSLTVSTQPVADVNGLISTSPATVTLSSGPIGRLGKIYYTMDGSSPLSSTTRVTYSVPFTITGPPAVNLQAVFVDEAGLASSIVSKTYTFGPVTPLKPSVTPPKQALMVGKTIVGRTVPVELVWTGLPAASTPITSYSLQRSLNGGAFAVDTPAPGAISAVNRLLIPGNSYRYEVKATDANNQSSGFIRGGLFTLSLLEETSAFLRYQGGWSRATSSSFVGGSLRFSTTRGSRASLTFTGTQVAWVTTKGPNMGIATVSIDGSAPVPVDLYQASLANRQLAFTKTDLASGTHTLVINVTGTRNRQSRSNRVDVDAMAVIL